MVMVTMKKAAILVDGWNEKNYLHRICNIKDYKQDKFHVDERNDDICGGGRKGVVDLGLGTVGAVT